MKRDMRRDWIVVYVVLLVVMVGTLLALGNDTAGERRAEPSTSPTARTTLIPPVTTTPRPTP